jgi:hypothetical protein
MTTFPMFRQPPPTILCQPLQDPSKECKFNQKKTYERVKVYK